MLCRQCPRRCGVDRSAGEIGACGAPAEILLARTMLHPWEEPCFGERAGALFFSGCSLGCVYCQNKPISAARPLPGKTCSPASLAAEILRLADAGAACIDLVTPTHFADRILDALRIARPRLSVPVVWNTGGYENADTIRACRGLVDVFLTDFKYGTPALAAAYSHAPDYPDAAATALAEMFRLTGPPQWEGNRLTRGTVVRHLVLPGGRHDSIAALRRAADAVPPGEVILSLMRQYTPDFAPAEIAALRRRVTTFEYESVREEALRLGFTVGYGQGKESASARFTPAWSGEA